MPYRAHPKSENDPFRKILWVASDYMSMDLKLSMLSPQANLPPGPRPPRARPTAAPLPLGAVQAPPDLPQTTLAATRPCIAEPWPQLSTCRRRRRNQIKGRRIHVTTHTIPRMLDLGFLQCPCTVPSFTHQRVHAFWTLQTLGSLQLFGRP